MEKTKKNNRYFYERITVKLTQNKMIGSNKNNRAFFKLFKWNGQGELN